MARGVEAVALVVEEAGEGRNESNALNGSAAPTSGAALFIRIRLRGVVWPSATTTGQAPSAKISSSGSFGARIWPVPRAQDLLR